MLISPNLFSKSRSVNVLVLFVFQDSWIVDHCCVLKLQSNLLNLVAMYISRLLAYLWARTVNLFCQIFVFIWNRVHATITKGWFQEPIICHFVSHTDILMTYCHLIMLNSVITLTSYVLKNFRSRIPLMYLMLIILISIWKWMNIINYRIRYMINMVTSIFLLSIFICLWSICFTAYLICESLFELSTLQI